PPRVGHDSPPLMTATARRVAVLADVHGNAVALVAVAEEVVAERPELVVFCGDLTWGPLPEETWRLICELPVAAVFVRGNAERALAEAEEPSTDRGRWLLDKHSPATLDALSEFVESATVDVAVSGPSASAMARRGATRSSSRARHPSRGCARSSRASPSGSSSPRTPTCSS